MKKPRNTQALDAAKVARKAARDAEIARGWRPRAQTFADKRAVGRKNACRGKFAA